jgi:hypothetical protein
LREWLESKEMKLEFYGKEIQVADAFTKILGKYLFQRFRTMIGLSTTKPEQSIIEGVCGKAGDYQEIKKPKSFVGQGNMIGKKYFFIF